MSDLTASIIGAVIEVHKGLGPGFLESVYRNALMVELLARGLEAQAEAEIRVNYKGRLVGIHRLDILVEGKVILELKTVKEFGGAHYAQLRSYLRATGLKVGLLVNFGGTMAEYRRVTPDGKGGLNGQREGD